MSAPATLRLDLDRLVDDYVHNLNVMLRGFRAVDGCDFLETFVPSEDPAASVRDLVELSRDAGVRTLTITMAARTAAILDRDRLEREVGEFGATRTADGLELVFSDETRGGPELAGIHPAYRQRLAEVLAGAKHEGPPPPAPAGRVVTCTRDAVAMWADVDPQTHIVRLAGFSGAGDAGERGMLEAFCRQMEGVPLVEAADHAAIRVEASLRDEVSPPPVPGTILPRNAGGAFVAVQQLVRDLLARYRSETGYADVANMFDQPVAEGWLRATAPRRLEMARAALATLAGGERLEIERLEGLRRLVVHFGDAVPDPGDQQKLLVDAENHLRASLQTPMQLVLEVKADKNVIRQLEPRK